MTTMHFLDDYAPIGLQTDASDYGVGGYLFQTVDGIDNPVAFVSKSLSKTTLACYTEGSLHNLLFVHVFKVTVTRS